MNIMMATPAIITQKPESAPLSQEETPTIRNNKPMEPTTGQWLPLGM